MGLDNSAIKFLCCAKSLGVDFSSTLTIGRQFLLADSEVLNQVFSVLGVNKDAQEFQRENQYAEMFFNDLGAKKVTSLDFSDYEGADEIHDMNSPVPERLQEQFSLVYDGGSLEHVFNVPQALANCMEMIQVGGYFIQANIANNFMGHGFWQFSPELNFRVFSPENGFQIEALLLNEQVPGGGWYSVTDPDEIKGRVELCNPTQTYMMTIAKKIAQKKIFSQWPQQSDYVVLWDHQGQSQSSSTSAKKKESALKTSTSRRWRDSLPAPLKRLFKPFYQVLFPPAPQPSSAVNRLGLGFDKPYYRLLDEMNLLHGRIE